MHYSYIELENHILLQWTYEHRQHTLITDPLCAAALTPAQLTIPLPCAGMSGREALTVATQGGAKVLGRDDVGRIAPGMAADFVAWRTDCLCFSGAQHDLIAALVFCTPGLPSVDLSVINGDVIVKDGQMLSCNVKVCGRLLSLLLLLSLLPPLSVLLATVTGCCLVPSSIMVILSSLHYTGAICQHSPLPCCCLQSVS